MPLTGIAENRRLKRLELRRNPIGVSGLISLRLAVSASRSLYKILIDVPDEENPAKEKLAVETYISIQNIAIAKLTSRQDQASVEV